jgi:RNA recognition motif-containing protein
MFEKLYIGNLPYLTTLAEIRTLFGPYEPVRSIILIADPETGLSRGFGFVELEEPKAMDALDNLDNKMFNGRNLRICKATGRVKTRTVKPINQREHVV